MAEKLQQGDRLPSLTLQLVDGGTITLPDDAPTRYTALLLYRGHWWPYCNRQLAEWEANKAELEELGVTTYAVSVDTKELAQEVVDNNKLTFPMGYDATKADGDLLGSWWSGGGGYIQPTEFLLERGGTVLGALYASGPVGRMGADEAIRLITRREDIRREEEGKAN